MHVVGARLGHGRQRVGRNPRPRRNADVNALFDIRAQILAPWIIGDVDLGGRIEWIDTGFAIPAQHDGPDVTRPHTIALHQLDQRRDQLFSGVVEIDTVDFGGVQQTLDVILGAEDRRPTWERVATDAFKDR